jgi:predicted RNA-binding Zn ribbon-like protein
MSTTDTEHGDRPAEAPLLADHLALDLLNTEARDGGAAVDFWHGGDDVLHWLARQGIIPAPGAEVDGCALLARAKALRALARELIALRKAGKVGDVTALNTYLHAHLGAPHVELDGNGQPVLRRVPRGDTVASLLGPVAEAVAQLLVDGDFNLVRQCEHPECVLWFYDRTKAHKRRWCSMALCGNRYKAAQFRKKASQGAAA